MQNIRKGAALVATGVALSACGGDSGEERAAAAQTAATAAGEEAYKPVSDVRAHGRIGDDVAEIRDLLAPAEDGGDADFDAAARIWSEGRNSAKGDGTSRTLAGFVEGTPVAERVEDALTGTGQARDLDAAQRRQWIDKGMTVALGEKILGELDAAAAKIDAGEIDAAEGAPHNVDEAWAFFVAEGEGVAATAAKRAIDFGLPETELADAVVVSLRDAQQAAVAGERERFETARDDVRGALNRIFALAVKKYAVEGQEDDVAREEGRAFSWALGDDLKGDDAAALAAAFDQASAAATGRVDRLLDRRAEALGIEAELPDYEG